MGNRKMAQQKNWSAVRHNLMLYLIRFMWRCLHSKNAMFTSMPKDISNFKPAIYYELLLYFLFYSIKVVWSFISNIYLRFNKIVRKLMLFQMLYF